MSPRRRRLVAAVIVLGLFAAAIAGWVLFAGGDLRDLPAMLKGLLGEAAVPKDIAQGNGRLEATELDIAAKLPGRLKEVRVREGDPVESGQVVAVLDTQTLEAEKRQAQAELRRAQQERERALAVVEQRKSELDLARKDHKRLQRLSASDRFVSDEQIDAARSREDTAQAALQAAQVGVVASEAAIEAAQAGIERIEADIADSTLRAPRSGRVLYRLAEPGEVLGAGGKALTILDLTDVYMVIFLPATEAGRVPLGAEARLRFDAARDYLIPASVSFVAPRAQFTPKQVETQDVRETLSFRVKVRIAPELLARYEDLVKIGVPGVAYVRLDTGTPWPEDLAPRLPPWPSASANQSSD